VPSDKIRHLCEIEGQPEAFCDRRGDRWIRASAGGCGGCSQFDEVFLESCWADDLDHPGRLGAGIMRANLLRDLALLPPAIRSGIASYPRTIAEVLDVGWPHQSRLRRAAIGHAVAFETWQSLAHHGLTDAEAAQLMTRLISTAADIPA
jgi:hypothetical protein